MVLANMSTELSGRVAIVTGGASGIGAAPAVIGRASSALAEGESVPWGEPQNQRAQAEMDRLGGKGLRIMAAAIQPPDVLVTHA